jgi:hypothetical protein
MRQLGCRTASLRECTQNNHTTVWFPLKRKASEKDQDQEKEKEKEKKKKDNAPFEAQGKETQSTRRFRREKDGQPRVAVLLRLVDFDLGAGGGAG